MTKFRKIAKFIKAQRALGHSEFKLLTTSDEVIISVNVDTKVKLRIKY